MARTDTLSNFLTDVAGAIKEKKGNQTSIPAANFDTEIRNLPSQGTYQTKVVTITSNKSTVITPDTNYDAIEEITVVTQIPEKQLQTKSYTFTENSTMNLTPETGYDGFSSVGITVQVPTGAQGVMLYETIQAMQADTTQSEGTYGVVAGTNFEGVYKYVNNNWEQVGDPIEALQAFNELADVVGDDIEYEGLGGTEEEITEILEDVIGEEGGAE
jgi:hypothetical protein